MLQQPIADYVLVESSAELDSVRHFHHQGVAVLEDYPQPQLHGNNVSGVPMSFLSQDRDVTLDHLESVDVAKLKGVLDIFAAKPALERSLVMQGAIFHVDRATTVTQRGEVGVAAIHPGQYTVSNISVHGNIGVFQ